MSDDEIIVLLACGAIALIGWGRFFFYLGSITVSAQALRQRFRFSLLPFVCLAGIFVILKTAASFDVRDSPTYLFFYTVMGAAWLCAGRWSLVLLGISWREDALERHNAAAAIAVSSALLGLSACYAGANIGDGPGWWCVVFAGGLASLVWLLLMGAVQATCDMAEAITVERDTACAIRLGGAMIACGLICGRGAAGDWTSAMQTAHELGVAWPAILLAVLAAVIERVVRRQPGRLEQPATNTMALVLAGAYIALALVILAVSPPLPHNPIYGASSPF